MKKKYFGTDGIRGTFNRFPITSSFFLDLTKSIKKTYNNIDKVLIGKDTRESSDLIESDIALGFKNVNVKCSSCGIVSTPMLSFNTKEFNYDFGIMISASHNPYEDNGIKIFDSNGEKLSDQDELKIEKNLNLTGIDHSSENIFNNLNNVSYSKYEDRLVKKFADLKGFNQNIFLDCANGSLSQIAPNIFERLDLNFSCSGVQPNGININKNCGATFPLELSKNTRKTKSNLGISFDGDADRVIFCDELGKIVDGDHILAILALFLKNTDQLKDNLVISTKMSNLGFRNFLNEKDINFLLSDVGDRYVVELMKKNNCILGGEQSGHIIFSENSFCGDGIYTALMIIKILEENKCNLSNLCEKLFTKAPQKLINFKLKQNPQEVIKNSKVQNILDRISNLEDCDVLLRKSGTENLLRLMVQGTSESLVNDVIKEFQYEINKIDEG